MCIGIPCRYTTALPGLGKYNTTIHKLGCENVDYKRNSVLISGAVEATSQADATIIIIGVDQTIEVGGLNKVSLLLPGEKEQLVFPILLLFKELHRST